MNDDFKYYKMSKKHKKYFVLHQALLFVVLAAIIIVAIKITNPEIVDTSDKMSLTMGGVVGFSVMILAFMNRLRNLIKIKFVAFLIIWVLLFSMQMIMTTLIWAIGFALIPLIIDDLILIPMWNRIWYNNYD
jgi:hypothetical protein